uniref:Uncharacterized protein n=1 Tax=Arundo donax TaxID=35708 RepID=A0A0A9B6R8_ARUDO
MVSWITTSGKFPQAAHKNRQAAQQPMQTKNKECTPINALAMLPTIRLSSSIACQASSVLGWRDNIVYLENHLHHLRSKQDLLLLANQCLKDILLFHVIRTNVIAVYTAVGIALLQR